MNDLGATGEGRGHCQLRLEGLDAHCGGAAFRPGMVPVPLGSPAALLRRVLIATGHPASNVDLAIAALPEEQRGPLLEQLRPRPALSKLRGSTIHLELIADFLGGIVRERKLRNVRQFAEALVAIRDAESWL